MGRFRIDKPGSRHILNSYVAVRSRRTEVPFPGFGVGARGARRVVGDRFRVRCGVTRSSSSSRAGSPRHSTPTGEASSRSERPKQLIVQSAYPTREPRRRSSREAGRAHESRDEPRGPDGPTTPSIRSRDECRDQSEPGSLNPSGLRRARWSSTPSRARQHGWPGNPGHRPVLSTPRSLPPRRPSRFRDPKTVRFGGTPP